MDYFAPGVYVEEVASSSAPIAGVGTSTAAFIGVFAGPIAGAPVANEPAAAVEGSPLVYRLPAYPVVAAAGSYAVRVDGAALPADGATLANDEAGKTSTLTLKAAPPAGAAVTADYTPVLPGRAAPGEVRLCTNFTEYAKSFGGFSVDAGRQRLTHAVYGFFNNGGTRCFVAYQATAASFDDVLSKLAAIDEIAIVAAPGIPEARDALVQHCAVATGDRFAILDADLADPSRPATLDNFKLPGHTTYAAVYYPYIRVSDPVARAADPAAGLVLVPPSGHVAGIYARVDAARGVHKAPANEPVYGAVEVGRLFGKAVQEGLNPKGVNCLRALGGNVTVWGARTLGGDDNGEFKYVNVRRLFLYLRKSIDRGTQWAVFEPNSPALWEKIKRNVGAFLTNVWRDGALFGASPAEAFYVKCDAETNPPELRDLGQLVTEIGVAVVKPAEFVVFRVSQWAGPGM